MQNQLSYFYFVLIFAKVNPSNKFWIGMSTGFVCSYDSSYQLHRVAISVREKNVLRLD